MDSFWEGVDIPGPQLSLVVLMRLPFRTPSEPLFQARWEALQRAGKDPFTHLSLPEAVIKFKQGFGRLIRTKKDRGAVVILDQRVCTRNYGRVFLSSIPGGKISNFRPPAWPKRWRSGWSKKIKIKKKDRDGFYRRKISPVFLWRKASKRNSYLQN